jgi:hypothetical protein
MAHEGLEWSHGMPYDDTRHTEVAKRGGSWLGVDRRGCQSSKGVDCDILTQGLVGLIENSYKKGASSFSEAYTKEPLG